MKRRSTTTKVLFALTVLLLAAQGQAQNSHQLSFKQSVEYGLKNHPSVAVYQNDVKIASEKAVEALAGYLPQVNGSVGVDDNLRLQTMVFQGNKVTLGSKFNTNASVQADQTLFDRSMLLGIKAAKPNTEIALLNKEKNDENIIYNVATAYAQAMIYNEQEKLLTENERKYQELLPALKLQYEKGVTKKIDFDRVRVNLLNIQSQKQVAHTNYELAVNQLKNAIGMPLNEAVNLTDSVSISTELPPLADTQEFKVANKLDYQLQQQNISLYQLDVKRKQAAHLPSVSLYARYGATALGQTLGKSYSNWFDFSALGVKMNVPLFSGFRRNSQLKQSKLGLENAMENLKINESNWTLQFQNAQTKLMSSYSNALTNKENLSLAQDVFVATSLQYQKGTALLTDLLNADYSYKEAQNNYITSIINYYIALADFEKAKGTLKTFVNTIQ